MTLDDLSTSFWINLRPHDVDILKIKKKIGVKQKISAKKDDFKFYL